MTGADQVHPERAEQALDLGVRQIEPRETLDEPGIEPEWRTGLWRMALQGLLAWAAAADVEHQLGRELKPRQHEMRIDAALEPETRVGLNVQLATRSRRALRIEICRLDEDIGGCLGRAGVLAADDATKPEHAALVGDDAHVVVD